MKICEHCQRTIHNELIDKIWEIQNTYDLTKPEMAYFLIEAGRVILSTELEVTE